MGAARRKVFDGDEWRIETVCQPDASPRKLHMSRPETHSGYRVYTHASGCRYAISPISRPSTEGIVFFSQAEYDWLRAQSLTNEEFKIAWALKREDHTYSPMPLEAVVEKKIAAQEISGQIINMLKHGKSV